MKLNQIHKRNFGFLILNLASSLLLQTSINTTAFAQTTQSDLNSKGLAPSQSSASCTQFEIQAQQKDGSQFFGNGFAISENRILTNDHVLGMQPANIKVKVVGKTTTARAEILSRDFHTDIAILKIDASIETQACNISSGLSQNSDSVEVKGVQNGQSQSISIPGKVIDPASNRMSVPGVAKSYEILPGQGVLPQAGRSGSPVFQNGKVIGIISQKTNENTFLAIPSEKILQSLEHKTKPNYKIDYENSNIKFRGLKIPLNNGGGNPHDGLSGGGNPHDSLTGGGNPHDGIRAPSQPIALETYNLGWVMADVENLSVFSQFEPAIAKAMQQTRVLRLFINSIDNQAVGNLLDFVRILGSCSSCRITGYFIEVQNPSSLTEPSVALRAQLLELIRWIDQSRTEMANRVALIEQIKSYQLCFGQLALQAESGKLDLTLKNQCNLKWKSFEDLFAKNNWPEETFEIIKEIRTSQYQLGLW